LQIDTLLDLFFFAFKVELLQLRGTVNASEQTNVLKGRSSINFAVLKIDQLIGFRCRAVSHLVKIKETVRNVELF
jgi:hypothetical protein